MNSEILAILDQALFGTAIAFLASFVLLAGYSAIRLRRRRRSLGEMIQQEIDPSLEESLGMDSAPAPAPRPRNRLRPFFYSFLMAGALGGVTFVMLLFAPLPFLHNFATEESWKGTPLRLTAVNYDRFFEGFSLEGEVWNQTEGDLSGVMAAIQILDLERAPLDELTAPVEPVLLQPATAGKFAFRYTENSPSIYGYRLQFRDADGNPIPHVEGFEVR